MSVDLRFWQKVDTSGSCWLWTAERSTNGYGRFWVNGRKIPAHRWSFEQVNGPVPAHLVIDHLCRTTACVNPEHLRAVTQRENLMSGRTIVAAEAARTICDNGHPLDGENVRLTPEGWRECLPCARARWRRKADRQKRERAIARGDA